MPEHYCIFTTQNGNSYLYDSSTSSIHPWNQPLNKEFAEKIYAASDDELVKAFESHFADSQIQERLLSYIYQWRKNTAAFRNVILPGSLSFKNLQDVPLEKKGPVWMSDLVLVATEACNLRCAYCSYSSNYESYRIHSDKMMSLSVAKKAIELFYSYNNDPVFHSYPDRNLNIVFYGGEPLLNFEVVKKAVLYAEQMKKDHYGLVISISTNLTLLKKEYLPFLRDHQIFVNVSLDGPPAEHDRYRSFVNGTPSGETVLANLEKICCFDERYYFQKVRILPTFNGNSNVYDSYKYFASRQEELPPFLMVNLLKDLSFSEFHKAYPYNQERFAQQIAAVLEVYVQEKTQGSHFHKGDFFFHFVEEAMNNLFQRVQSYGSGYPAWYTGTCLPGRKIAVAPDGTLHMCERINEHFPIGDVETGLDIGSILAIVNRYFESLPSCQSCWARNLCTICYATVCREGQFDFSQQCSQVRKNVQANLSLLYTILEKNWSAFPAKDEFIAMPAMAQKEACRGGVW